MIQKTSKKHIAIILGTLLLLTIVLFGRTISVDKQFVRDLTLGLENTWDTLDNTGDIADLSQEEIISLIRGEYRYIKGYDPEGFHDKELSDLARGYIADLKKCMSIVKKTDPQMNYQHFRDSFMPVYEDRLLLVYTVYQGKYGMKVTQDKYKQQFQDFIAEGWLKKRLSTADFNKSASKKGYVSYSATLKNDSGYDIDMCTLEINVLNKKGKKVGTISADLSDWKKGEERELIFYKVRKTAEDREIVSVVCNTGQM